MAVNLGVRLPDEWPYKNTLVISSTSQVDFVGLQDEPAPGTSGVFSGLVRTDPPINDAGQTAFLSSFKDPDTQQQISTAVYVGNPQSLNLVAEFGKEAPGTTGTFYSLGGRDSRRMPLNSNGDTTFQAVLNIPGESQFVPSIWRSRNRVAELVALRGDVALPATDGFSGATFNFFGRVTINDTDSVVFSAELAGEDITFSNRSTIWSATSDGLELVVQSGMTAPGTNDPFGTFSDGLFATNNAGQLLLLATAGGKVGLWAQDPSGALRLIVRAGDTIETSPDEFRTVANVMVPNFSGGSDGRGRSINDAGEIVYAVVLPMVPKEFLPPTSPAITWLTSIVTATSTPPI